MVEQRSRGTVTSSGNMSDQDFNAMLPASSKIRSIGSSPRRSSTPTPKPTPIKPAPAPKINPNASKPTTFSTSSSVGGMTQKDKDIGLNNLFSKQPGS